MMSNAQKEIKELAQMVADGFAAAATAMATKEELHGLENKINRLEQNMKAGFSLMMENIVPLRRDYEALKDDLAPQVTSHDARLARVERKVGL